MIIFFEITTIVLTLVWIHIISLLWININFKINRKRGKINKRKNCHLVEDHLLKKHQVKHKHNRYPKSQRKLKRSQDKIGNRHLN